MPQPLFLCMPYLMKALFFDIDGTLVSYKTHEIPSSTIEALTEAKAKGHLIFIATGRPRALVNNLGVLQERNLIDGYITMDGSYCFTGERVIYQKPIPREDVEAIMDYCAGRHIPCVVSGENDICMCHPNALLNYIFHDLLKVGHLPEKTPEEAIRGKEIFQLNPCITAEEEDFLLSLNHGCEINRWYDSLADITVKGNTKGHGIEQVIDYYGIPLCDTLAFGDADNDISMLRHAGIGIAVGNAARHVQAEASYVTATVEEDGIARALRHFCIIE